MSARISATEAARTFSALLNKVRYRGEEFVVERGGEPVCRISPVGPAPCTGADLAELLGTLPPLDAAYWNAVERATKRQPKLPTPRWPR